MVVVVLLHINCFAQYALCGLNVGYRRSQRPAIGVGLCISVAIAAPAIAGVYSILSPLGRDYELQTDQEAQDQIGGDVDNSVNLRRKSLERKYSFWSRDGEKVAESRPEWKGGLFDLWEDISVAYLSMFCCFCVFGWNMERLGFGNMYVHIATFLLLCMAPFWIFNLAAVNIDNEVVREALGVTGIMLCVFGLLYGGFWRIQMRKRFNLPGNDFFCGYPAAVDCMQWLCCCTCSLAQEVRTGDSYDIGEDKFYRKQIGGNFQPTLSSVPQDEESPHHDDTTCSLIDRESPASKWKWFCKLQCVVEESLIVLTCDCVIPYGHYYSWISNLQVTSSPGMRSDHFFCYGFFFALPGMSRNGIQLSCVGDDSPRSDCQGQEVCVEQQLKVWSKNQIPLVDGYIHKNGTSMQVIIVAC
ncbi:hypothetical protein MRB53_033031 [Persea americana]|uniref:Uncharacterized protein n=1 Tax=Persea americana TaxID=3435 RepID=A0ACC2KUF0_PERAE|nr:hypothetical protein MRB53_033031 [Persea americana]